MKRTKYQKLQKAKSKHCDGKITKADLNKVKKEYIDHAVSKGQSKKEATSKANRVVNGKCSLSSSSSSKKRKK